MKKIYTHEVFSRLKTIFKDFPNMKFTYYDELSEPDETEYELLQLMADKEVRNKDGKCFKDRLSISIEDSPIDVEEIFGYEDEIIEINIYEGRLGIEGGDFDTWYCELEPEEKDAIYPLLKEKIQKEYDRD